MRSRTAQKAQNDDSAWLLLTDILRVLDVSRSYFDRELRRALPPGCERKVGNRVWLHGRTVIETWADNRGRGFPKRTNGNGNGTGSGHRPDEETILMSGDSPALERYRLAKAKREEIQLARDREEIIDRSDCARVLQRVASHLRGLGGALARRFGREAHALLD